MNENTLWAVLVVCVAVVLCTFIIFSDQLPSSADELKYQHRMYDSYLDVCVEQGIEPTPPNEWNFDNETSVE